MPAKNPPAPVWKSYPEPASFPSEYARDAYRRAKSKIREVFLSSQPTGLLNLSGKGLTALPPEIGQLTALTELKLSNNQLTKLPPELGQLTTLRWLDLSGNKLAELPPELGQLTELAMLNISSNHLAELPAKIKHLSALKVLQLSKNRLMALPPEIGQLTALLWLDLSENQLSALPPELKELKLLQALYLHGNEALCLIPEVLGMTQHETSVLHKGAADPRRILDYYFATQRGARRLNEAKVIFVGRGGAGKTTLRKQLMKQHIPAKERRTKGIELRRWELEVEGETLGLNLWDFGGQEVMYSTHQFFLTERAVYILVLDARSGPQDENIDYWLRLVEELGRGSPVVMVLNQIDENEGLELDDVGWIKKFPFITATIRTCAKKTKDIGRLVAALREALHRKLPEAHRDYPAEWWAVKQALTDMRVRLKKDYITEKEYTELCEKHKVQPGDRQTLLENVRDLGLVSYFPQMSKLGLPPVLQPGWLTGGLYSLIDNPKLKKQGGVVKACEVYDYLREPERYDRTHGLLFLKVAEEFHLGFAVAGKKEEYMLTALLSEKTPRLPHWQKEDDELRLELLYTKVLPEGLLAQFIAVAHAHNKGGARWRNGVELVLDGATALVTADVPDKRITIRVRGKGRAPLALMTVIRTHFRTLSTRLTLPRELVPLKGYDADPLAYTHLLALEDAKQTHAQVTDRNGKLHFIPVKPLLDLYQDEREREAARMEKIIREEGRETRRHVSAEAGTLREVLKEVAQGRAADSAALVKVREAMRHGELRQSSVLKAVEQGFARLEQEVLTQAQRVTKSLTHPGQKKPWRFLARPKEGGKKLTSQVWEFLLIDEHTQRVVVPFVAEQAILEYKVPRAEYAMLVKWTKRTFALGFLACGVAGAATGDGLELNPAPESNAEDLTDLLDQMTTLTSTLGPEAEDVSGVEAVEFFQTKVLPANPEWERALTQVELPEGGWKWVGPESLRFYKKPRQR